MRIAVNTRFLLSSKMEGFGWFTYETVKRIVEAHPEHEFLFYFDRPFDPKFIFGDNVKGYVLHPQARHPILFKWWFNGSVTRALKKHQADVFFSPDGYLSLKTFVPQVAVIHDLNFEHHPGDLPKSARNYLRKYFPRFAKKAKEIITVSEYSKKDIIETYGIPAEKITVAHNGGSDIFKPITENEKITFKNTYTQGEEFFVFVGALHPRKNLKRLLQAFDQFKKETNSKTKLLIIGSEMWKNKKFKKQLSELKFINEIIFLGHLPFDQLAKAVGAAKALVFPSYYEGFGIPLVEAMKAGCPIVAGNKTALPEVAGEAALYFDPFSINGIQSALKTIDSDADLRAHLVEKGHNQGAKYSWDDTASTIWSVLQNFEN